MVFAKRRASVRGLVALLVVALVVLAACDSDDGSGSASDNDDVQSENGDATGTPEEADNEDDQGNSDGEDQESEEETGVEGATAKQQKRIDRGKPTLLIRAPDDGAQVESPMPMSFEVLNGEIVQNSADEDGYVIFVKVGKSASVIPIYDDQGEIRLPKNGRTKITAMLGGQKGPIKKTGVTIAVTVTGAGGGKGSSSDDSSG
jgi:hypothetical protein